VVACFVGLPSGVHALYGIILYAADTASVAVVRRESSQFRNLLHCVASHCMVLFPPSQLEGMLTSLACSFMQADGLDWPIVGHYIFGMFCVGFRKRHVHVYVPTSQSTIG
jgi:hypothetical protein